jgi:hypothetical protein
MDGGVAGCAASTEAGDEAGVETAWAIAADESAHVAISAAAPKIFKFTENSPFPALATVTAVSPKKRPERP